jgi:hypothetical protein
MTDKIRLASVCCVVLAGTLTGLAALPGCGGDDGTQRASKPSTTGPDRRDEGREAPKGARVGAPRPPPCAPGASNCRRASGRILYVERVDPDGDGDAHFVLISAQSVTLPGITVVDVERELRPHPLPGPGDLLAAAGPVYRGSYGQRQIQATEIRVAGNSSSPPGG